MIRPRLGWSLPRVFAHRCGGALAPENTLAGLRIAARMGVRAVEFDVMLSADGSPWLMHDERLERTSNGSGRVCETSDATLRVLDAGAYQHPAFLGEPVPSLASAALLCRQLGLVANVEIKPAAGFEVLTGEVVARQVREFWAGTELPLVSSFSEDALLAAREVAPELPLGALYERPPDDWLTRVNRVAALSLHCDAEQLDDSVLSRARANGIPLLCYTVNELGAAEALFRRGVMAVFSDRIDCVRDSSEIFLPALAMRQP
ncbi:MAG: Glycerophosphoryl diester phosphodiesterase [Candidatus Accumulibacter regalis]|uniref:Glycerophosphoryl diester phosphodiesterase n=1 Tax=Accumulibacter regalis TaxID=522306 RepID=A0A011QLQ3_ACCRE|nr:MULTISPECIES: glycerophosphodiester phosphodiesterase [unclassified Candidatus Accumulibacter]EXI89935.1 MAG: Glycerophosphoryl diester phosphodiesterase [Candidatus Accumulibacter regalis]MQM34140.1 glycerophosphodiester phosphodiesterase [Candidatus Accumulibacter phosphatis]MBL8367230.1 glycerophosphodiester phosphodiesterase [Accumulibacter sp.]MBN8513416.1 glycerophosphodiester phosphodiesterase [Accumulibacter sp.]MBO3703094.1 glycerophosphodiester phosphodiesterase [Accumulibacter sp